MANRSDFQSALPRTIKRLINLAPDADAHQRGVWRRLFMEAHAHHKRIRAMRLVSKTNVDESKAVEADTATV